MKAIILAAIAVAISYIGVAVSNYTDAPTKAQIEIKARSEYYNSHSYSMEGYGCEEYTPNSYD